jgi:hypothetical protein
MRIVDMSASNSSAELAAVFQSTRVAFVEYGRAKSELKVLMTMPRKSSGAASGPRVPNPVL